MSATVAVMQPYAFPYIGYFNLVEASDYFVFLDDVNFIKRGWINRNSILTSGGTFRFTIPLAKASQNRLICDTKTHSFSSFKTDFIKQVKQSYKRSAFYDQGLAYLEQVFSDDCTSIAEIAIRSIESLYSLIGEKKIFFRSSILSPESRGTQKETRLIEIAKSLNSSRYINAEGGTEIYNKDRFSEQGVELLFVKPILLPYKQLGRDGFTPRMSIIDAIMNNDTEALKKLIRSYELF